jgi:hypothetical protein
MTLLQRIGKALSFANIVSMLALMLAMGGAGYALTIPKNSVGSQQIKNNAEGEGREGRVAALL